jgi:hypothetical protein
VGATRVLCLPKGSLIVKDFIAGSKENCALAYFLEDEGLSLLAEICRWFIQDRILDGQIVV